MAGRRKKNMTAEEELAYLETDISKKASGKTVGELLEFMKTENAE